MNDNLEKDLAEIFEKIKEVAIYIQGVIGESEGEYFETQNSTGDMQLKADVKADLIIEKELSKIATIKSLCSEEKDECVICNLDGRYHVGYDPLDGSSIVEANLSVGTIFGIYDGEFTGENLVASAYVVYGPGIELVLAHKSVDLYTFQYGVFEYKKSLILKERGNINSPGGTQQHWEKHHKEVIESFFNEGYRLRYSGGMVPDLHQILIKGGGIFSYPGTADRPKGKLRMIFEVLPFAHIYELAGGGAIDAKSTRALELKPEHYHDTTPCFLGSKYEIEKIKEAYAKS